MLEANGQRNLTKREEHDLGAIHLAADRALTDGAIAQVARLHVSEIPGGFLTQFGEAFLRLVYGAVAEHRNSFIIGAIRGHDLMGFICGSTDTGGLYRDFALSRGFVALRTILPGALRIRVLRGIIETVMYPGRPIADLPQAAILNFAVDPAARGRGVGNRLLHALGVEFRRRGEERIRIVCGAEQMAAQRLYLRNGATEVCDLELHRGVRSKVFVWYSALADDGIAGWGATADTRHSAS